MRVIKNNYKLLSASLTLTIIVALVLVGPADAFTLSLMTETPEVTAGEHASFIASVDIESGERLPIDYMELTLGPIECRFAPDGTAILGCDGLIITQLQTAETSQGNLGGEFQGTAYNFGYGYGYGSGTPQTLRYNITFDSSLVPTGQYTARLNAKMQNTPILFLGGETDITINSPGYQLFIDKPQTSVYESNRIPFQLTTTENSEEIVYINHDENIPRETRLCRDCNQFGVDREKTIVLKEGQNRLEFIARSTIGEVAKKEVTVFIDNKAPRITRAEPRSGFTQGNFHVEFSELNPEQLILHYGNAQTGMRMHEVDIDQKCTMDRIYRCDFDVDLSDYDEEQITYYFELRDISGKTDVNRSYTLKIDITPPTVGQVDFSIEGNRVTFEIPITEPNFAELSYIDQEETIPREHRLCYRLENGICRETDSFGEGPHTLDYTVKDQAGNMNTGSIAFFIDSRAPRIIRTEPRGGEATGTFFVRFREANPEDLVLHYGNSGTGMRTHMVNLASCTHQNIDTECNTNVDLSDFTGEEITYFFRLTDRVGQVDTSNTIVLSA